MALISRKKLGTTLNTELLDMFRELSKKSRIPLSRLTDEAIEDLLKKHGVVEAGKTKGHISVEGVL
jgi:hypothetical protein